MDTALLRSAFLFLAVQFSLLAQNNSQLAHLSGTLSDASGSGIGDVLVHARAEGSSNSLTWSAKSSPGGEYSLDLPAGRYRMQFTRPSFASREFVVDLAPGESHTLNLRLDLPQLGAVIPVVEASDQISLADVVPFVDEDLRDDSIDLGPDVRVVNGRDCHIARHREFQPAREEKNGARPENHEGFCRTLQQ